MTIARMITVIRGILRNMKNGEIRLLVRNGEIKYINVLHEVKMDERDVNLF